MSRIDELSAELCPDRVEFKELGAVAAYSDTRVAASRVSGETFVGVDNLRPNQAGGTASEYVPTAGNLTEYRAGDVLIGNNRPYLKKIWLATNNGGCSGDVLAVRINHSYRDALAPEFLFRLLSSEAFFAYDMQHAKGGKMPRGSRPVILKYRIPVPPLEVQREIVRVLDTFTELEAELEAEQEARRRQYAHYWKPLLTSRGGWSTTTVGEAAEVFDGPHATPKKTESGPWYLSISSLKNGRFDLTESAHLSEAEFPTWTRRVTPRVGDTLFSYETRIGQAASWVREEPAALGRWMGLPRPRKGVIDPRFLTLVYLGPQFQALIESKTVRGSTVDRIPIADVASWELSIPPLAE